MFGKLFGANKSTAASSKSRTANKAKGSEAKPPAPTAPKLKKSNIKSRFQIIGEAGQGSMSKVYRAIDNDSGRLVCLKIQDRAKTEAHIERASLAGRPHEGVIGAQIRHRNVVKTLDYGISTKKEHFLTMEFIEGVSLNSIRESRSRDLEAKVDLLLQAAEGLAATHAQGFIHHDFGPKNVLVTKDEVAKVIDFGLAVPNTPQFRKPGNRTGTLQYMAPELMRREPTDERIDIFSWGLMAFELLTDRIPYDAKDQMALMRLRMNTDPIDISLIAPDLDLDLQQVIRKSIARDPRERWSSMTDVIGALSALPMVHRDQE